jgi:hypothetical protein
MCPYSPQGFKILALGIKKKEKNQKLSKASKEFFNSLISESYALFCVLVDVLSLDILIHFQLVVSFED